MPERRLDILGSFQGMAGSIGLAFRQSAGQAGTRADVRVDRIRDGLVAIILLVRRQRRSAHPMLDFALFRAAGFTPAVLCTIVEEVSFELGGALGLTFVGSLLSAIYIVSMAATPMGHGARERIDHALIVAGSLSAPEGQALLELAHASVDSGFVVSSAFVATLLCITAAAIAWRSRCTVHGAAPQPDSR